jgi:hypothetical protein
VCVCVCMCVRVGGCVGVWVGVHVYSRSCRNETEASAIQLCDYLHHASL